MASNYSRIFEYLRVSITDRCNLRCIYCMPPEGVPKLDHEQIIRYETIISVVEAAVAEGVNKVRITGGEPLVRRGVVDLVRRLTHVPGLHEVTMTTNGTLLQKFAAQLKEAGLRRVNISLDSLKAERFARITRLGHIEDVFAGIDAAIKHGLVPVKINVVIIPGENDDEILDFGRFAYEHPVVVRFIERMPFQVDESSDAPFVSQEEIFERLSRVYSLIPEVSESGAGPAREFRIAGGVGKIGFISSRTHPFCQSCNRLRLTAAGILKPCLDSPVGISIVGKDVDGIRTIIRELAVTKHSWGKKCASFNGARCVSLSDIGG